MTLVDRITRRHVRHVAAGDGAGPLPDQIRREFGLLAPPIRLHAAAPDCLAAAWMLVRETLLAGTRTTRAAREAIAVEVSRANACPYCVEVHTTALLGLASLPPAPPSVDTTGGTRAARATGVGAVAPADATDTAGGGSVAGTAGGGTGAGPAGGGTGAGVAGDTTGAGAAGDGTGAGPAGNGTGAGVAGGGTGAGVATGTGAAGGGAGAGAAGDGTGASPAGNGIGAGVARGGTGAGDATGTGAAGGEVGAGAGVGVGVGVGVAGGGGVGGVAPVGGGERERVAELVGTAVAFHYLNRMVNVFLAPSAVPAAVPGAARERLRRVAGRVWRGRLTATVPPGVSLGLLPPADLPPDLAWAGDGPVGQAYARAAAAFEAAGERSVPAAVRALVTDRLASWDGTPPGITRGWADDAVAGLPAADRAAGRLALLTALAAYQVDPKVVRDVGADDRTLVELTAWAAFAAARRMGQHSDDAGTSPDGCQRPVSGTRGDLSASSSTQ